jgi:NADH-quinone oxidoreductase subunit H
MTSVLIVIFFFGGWLPPPFLIIILTCLFFSPYLFFLPEFSKYLDFLGELTSFWFAFKVVILLFLIIWIRASFPRYRYDQLMQLGWKVFLPISLGYLIFLSGFLFAFDALPTIL